MKTSAFQKYRDNFDMEFKTRGTDITTEKVPTTKKIPTIKTHTDVLGNTLVSKEATKRKTLAESLRTRRFAWGKASRIMWTTMLDFSNEWEILTGRTFHIERRTNASQLTVNANCVSMLNDTWTTGVKIKNFQGITMNIERDGCLKMLQMEDGRITILATPRTTPQKNFPFTSIMIFEPMEPNSMTYTKAEHAIKEFMWLQRITGASGIFNLWDRLLLFRYWVRDWRNANRWAAWVTLWIAVVTLIFAAISTAASIKALLGTH